MAKSSPNRYKTLWAKEKLLVTSNFSFAHVVFERLVLQTRKNQGLSGKGLNKLSLSKPTNVVFLLLHNCAVCIKIDDVLKHRPTY